MELTTTNKDHFDPTPKLKSNPIPILFVPLKYESMFDKFRDNNESRCNYCNNEYFTTVLFGQKYCKDCLLQYIKNIKNTMYYADSNAYLDVHIRTTKQCIQHEITRNTDLCPRNIQEWCEYCSEVAHFNQVAASKRKDYHYYIKVNSILENEKCCKLCGKLIYRRDTGFFKLCSDCYVVSSGWIESTLTKKSIPILYLPWWDVSNKCIVCQYYLKFTSDCQKWCSHCIIIYTGCRYCLTTNIIFGITNHSQCQKCKRTLFVDLKIDITSICSSNDNVDEYLGYNNYHLTLIANYEKLNKNFDPLFVYKFFRYFTPVFKWYPFSKITNLEKIAEGGFGIVYKATLKNRSFGKTVAVKRFKSQNINKYFLNEVINYLFVQI